MWTYYVGMAKGRYDMKLMRKLVFGFSFICAACCTASPVTSDLTVTAQYEKMETLTVYEDLDEAKEAAMRDGKLIFLLSGATWCGYTVQLQQYIADAGTDFADNYVYLWHDRDKDPFGIAATSTIPEFWIFQPSELNLETKDAWDETALYVCRGCPSRYESFLSVVNQYVASRPEKGVAISLDATGGDVSSSSIVRTPGAAYGSLPDPVRAGYVFAGWFTLPNGGIQVTATTIVSSSVTQLYAHWEPAPDVDPNPVSDWTPVVQPETIIGYFVVSNVESGAFVEAQGSKLAAFAANGECRGVAGIIDGPNGKLFSISIGVENSTEAGLTLKCWDAATGKTNSVNEYVIDASVVGERIGRIVEPQLVWIGERPAVKPQTHTVTFKLGEHGTRTGGGFLTQSVEDGAAAVAPTFTVSDGWEFTGWDRTFDRVTSDLTVTALWKETEVAPIDDPEAWRAGEAGEIAAPESTLTGKTSWSAKNLPKGLKIDSKTGVISGTPTAPGEYVVKVTAKSGQGTETFDVEVTVGHYVDENLPIEEAYEAQVGVKTLVELGSAFAGCKATGLPVGLKFAAKDVRDRDFGEISAGTVYGVPSKACTNSVVFTYKEGTSTHAASATFAVAAAPTWSVGTFNGRLDDGSGSATLTVAAGGKVSGKVVADGKTWSFSSSGYEEAKDGDEGVEELLILATAKSGRLTSDVALTVGRDGVTGGISGEDVDASLTLWRNGWKDRGATDRLREYVGLYTVQLAGDGVGTGYLSLTVDAKGACKATGKLPDGTSASGTLPLVWNGEGDAPMAVWQMAPSAYKGGCVGGLLKWAHGDGDGAVDATSSSRQLSGESIIWRSKAPTASDGYGAGFDRTLAARGAYYNRLAELSDYYTTLAFGAEVPMLDVTVKTTDYDENEKKTTTSEREGLSAVEPACWGSLTVSLDAKGTAFVVDQGKATKPVQDRETKEWSYEGANDAALSLSFTKATGVFKGSFTCWYDYVSATDNTKDPVKETLIHTSKKVSYEGVMILGEALRGFYLWDRTGVYEDERTGKEKTFKYKESRPVVFQ